MAEAPQEQAHREAILEIIVNVVAPTIVLMMLSSDAYLGSAGGLLAALAFPTGHSIRGVIRAGRVSPLAVIALVSILLTGGIGLLEIEVRWFAWKEAAFSLFFGVATVASTRTRWPAIPTMLDPLLDSDKLNALLDQRQQREGYEADLMRATWMLGAVFLITAVASFFFARFMVTSPTGTEAFNTELGRYTAISFPAIGIPSTVLMVWVLRGVLISIEQRTGQEIDDLLR